MRGCPYWNTSSTADMDTTAPAATIHEAVSSPATWSARASGSLERSSW